jgi:FKBP-type peptidyl-prolyl cis-trans isomerase
MATARPFAYNTGSPIPGTEQIGDLSIGAPLSGLIQAWQLMLPLIGAGGRIKFVTPSFYAYGCQSVGSIPSNSPLFFDVQLNSVS